MIDRSTRYGRNAFNLVSLDIAAHDTKNNIFYLAEGSTSVGDKFVVVEQVLNGTDASRYFAAFLKRILLPEKRFYTAVFAYAVIIGLLTLAVPVAVQTLINTVATVAVPQSLFVLAGLLFLLLSFSATMQAMQLYTMELFERRFFARIAAEITHVLLHARPEAANQSAIIDRFFEVMHVQKSVPALCVGGFTLLLQMGIGFLVVSLYHPWFLVFNLVLLVCCALVWRLWHQCAQKAAVKASSARYQMAGWLEELARGESRYRSETGRPQSRAISDRITHSYLDARESFFRANFRQIMGFLTLYVLGSVALLALGGWLVLRGQLTLGQLVAGELILSAIFYGIVRMGYYLTLYYELCAGALKLDELLSLPQVENAPPVEALSAQGRVRLPNALRVLVRSIFGGLLLLIFAMVFVPWIQTAAGSGTIIALHPEGQAQNIHAPVPGRINRWYVRDGSSVQAGDPIVEIEDNDPQLIERLGMERDAARAAQTAARVASQTALLDVRRKENLFKQGLSARRELEQARIQVATWQAKEAEAASKLASAETKLSRQHAQLVRAPKAGSVLRTQGGYTASLVKAGDLLATFAPEQTQIAAEVYVGGLDAPLVHPGRHIQLQFEGWPVIQLSGWPSVSVGTFAGIVASVDPASSANGKYRVLVVPADTQAWPDARYLRLGSRLRGWVQLNEVRLGYEFWRQLNGFPPESTKASEPAKGNAS